MNTNEIRYPWLWDVDLDNAAFEAVLRAEAMVSGLDADWAMLRLIEYAPYHEIRRLLPLDAFLRRWADIMPRVRSTSRREGMDYFAAWIRRKGAAHG